MILVEKHIIKPTHPLYEEIDKNGFLSKNLYNRANYIVRQEFINTSKEKELNKRESAVYLNYYSIRKQLLKDEDYTKLPRKVSNHVLMQLDRNWKSFFASIKDWKQNKEKYIGRPSLPRYKNKLTGRFILGYELGAISIKELKKGFIKLSGTNIIIPFKNKDQKLIGARVVPTPTKYYKIEIIYEKKEVENKNNNQKNMGIDIGVDNLMALTSNEKGFKPIIINGGPVKSINQYYNKKAALFQSELPKEVYYSKKLRILLQKRNNKIENYFHEASKYVVRQCLENDISTIAIGHNPLWKQKSNMNKKNNQEFVNIPFQKLINQIAYKAQLKGINVIPDVEESYTSKASFLNQDFMPVFKKGDTDVYKFSGYRQHRGLYKIKGEKRTINADVNGSYNIIRKVAPNAFADGVEGFAVIPAKVTFC